MKNTYSLTLTSDERRAIDWIGGRYSHGTELCDLLLSCDDAQLFWNDTCDFTFHMPEHIAWQINDIINGEDGLACFAPSLVNKLRQFSDQVV